MLLITREVLAENGSPMPQLHAGKEPVLERFENDVFMRLADFTQPKHDWDTIHLVALFYVALMSVGNYLLFRRSKGYAGSLLYSAGLIVVAALLLGAIGRRGYGEIASTHSLSVARPLAGNVYDVTQWYNAFTTNGGYYTFAHQSPHSVYSTCQDVEAVNAILQNGRDGKMLVDMPLYSQRSFLHRGKLNGHEGSVNVLEWPSAESLDGLVLSLGGEFAPLRGWSCAVYGERVYCLGWEGDRLRALGGEPLLLGDFLSRADLDLRRDDDVAVQGPDFLPEETDIKTHIPVGYDELLKPLIAWSLGGTDAFSHYVTYPGSGHETNEMQLFVFVPSPAGFRLVVDGLGTEEGYTLYHFAVGRPEPRTDAGNSEG